MTSLSNKTEQNKLAASKLTPSRYQKLPSLWLISSLSGGRTKGVVSCRRRRRAIGTSRNLHTRRQATNQFCTYHGIPFVSFVLAGTLARICVESVWKNRSFISNFSFGIQSISKYHIPRAPWIFSRQITFIIDLSRKPFTGIGLVDEATIAIVHWSAANMALGVFFFL